MILFSTKARVILGLFIIYGVVCQPTKKKESCSILQTFVDGVGK